MNLIIKIISGIAIALIVALIVYVFKIKQLYLRVPRLFGYGGLTGKGKLVEMQAVNRGRSMEEDVHIDMPPNLTYELIASDHTDVKLENNKIVLSRIPPKTEVSMILLAEGSIESETFSPTITSKTSMGKVLKENADVPPNYGNVLINTLLFIISFGIASYLPAKYIAYKAHLATQQYHDRYSFLFDNGWDHFDVFTSSDYAQSYGKSEFPLVFTGVKKTAKNAYQLSFMATNKTTSVLTISASYDGGPDVFCAALGVSSPANTTINPLSAKPILISYTPSQNKKLPDTSIGFSIKFSNRSYWGTIFTPAKNPVIRDVINSNT